MVLPTWGLATASFFCMFLRAVLLEEKIGYWGVALFILTAFRSAQLKDTVG